MPRFMCFRWKPADWERGKRALALADKLTSQKNWSLVLKWRGIIILGYADAEPDWGAGPGGFSVVFGSIFRRNEARPTPASLDVDESLAAAESDGRTLLERYFGGYVAFLLNHAHDNVHVIRDPTCAVPCWIACLDGIHVVFSDARDYAAIGAPLDVDESRVVAFLLQPRFSTRRAGLAGVEELHGGECVTLGRDFYRRTVLWRPHLSHGAQFDDFDSAKDALRSAVLQCVSAWSSSTQRVALKLSGGLDSTLVLQCLALLRPDLDIVCANLFSPAAPEGDERFFAAAAAQHARKPLVTIKAMPEDIDYQRAMGAPLFAGPVRSCLDWANPKLANDIEALNVNVLLSGQAGDHVFHRNRTPLIAADAVREGLAFGDWFSVAVDTAHVSGRSIWSVIGDSIRYGWAHRPLDLYRVLHRDRPLIAKPDASLLRDFAAHPWLDGWRKLPAGKAQRVALLLDAEHYNDANLLKTRLACVAPLYSQPIIEVSMRIPPRLMTYGGKDRALIRSAFQAELPELVLKRSTKGETTRFFAAVIQRNRAFLGDALLSGRLRARGLLNVAAVEAALKPEATSNEGVNDLLICLAAEVWLNAVARGHSDAIPAAA